MAMIGVSATVLSDLLLHTSLIAKPIHLLRQVRQAIKERTIAPRCLPQIFGRDVVTTVPLVFQLGTLRGKNCSAMRVRV